jgi:hypothetical protein
MIIKFTKKQKDYLINNCLLQKEDLTKLLSTGKEQFNSFIIELSEDKIDELRDICSDKLQEIGFDEDYELTNDGKMLEELIDLLYIK